MAIAYVQSNKNYGTGATVDCAFSSNVGNGSLIPVVITQYKDGGISSDSAVSGTNCGTFTKVGNRVVLSSGMSIEIFTGFTTGAGASTITVDPESNSTSVAIHEFSGVASTNFIDTQDNNTGTSAAPTAGPISTTTADCMLFFAMTSGAWGAAAGEAINPAWSSAVSYSVNQVVTYSGVVYLSLQNSNNNHQPDISPTWWQAYYTQMQEYEDGDSYSVLNTNYMQLSGTISNSTFYWFLGASWNWGGWVLAFKPAAGGGGLVVPVAMHHMKQQGMS